MRLSRREFLAAGAAAAALPRPRPPDQRSTLVIVTDQFTWWMADPAQRGALDLPAIDRLRNEGTSFERCYVTSPVCAAARVTLRTGLWPHANPGGVSLDYSVRTVEQEMLSRGHRTRYIGKWHLSPGQNPTEYVLPENRLFWKTFVGHEKDHSSNITFVMNDPTPVSTAPWDSAVMTDFAIRQLRNDAAAGRPFFMQVNYLPPHLPNNYPTSLNVYQWWDAPIRANVPAGNVSQAQQRIAGYMNAARGVDIEVGRLLNELDVLGIDPVVVFTSDHGDMLWSHGLQEKRKPWEEAARIPLIVRGGGWPNHAVPYPVGLVDLARTVAGIGQGIDLRHARDSVYYEMDSPGQSWANGRWRALVTDDGWKLAVSENGPRLLYDLGNDPFELVDLSGQGHPKEKELLDRMREWAHATGDV